VQRTCRRQHLITAERWKTREKWAPFPTRVLVSAELSSNATYRCRAAPCGRRLSTEKLPAAAGPTRRLSDACLTDQYAPAAPNPSLSIAYRTQLIWLTDSVYECGREIRPSIFRSKCEITYWRAGNDRPGTYQRAYSPHCQLHSLCVLSSMFLHIYWLCSTDEPAMPLRQLEESGWQQLVVVCDGKDSPLQRSSKSQSVIGWFCWRFGRLSLPKCSHKPPQMANINYNPQNRNIAITLRGGCQSNLYTGSLLCNFLWRKV